MNDPSTATCTKGLPNRVQYYRVLLFTSASIPLRSCRVTSASHWDDIFKGSSHLSPSQVPVSGSERAPLDFHTCDEWSPSLRTPGIDTPPLSATDGILKILTWETAQSISRLLTVEYCTYDRGPSLFVSNQAFLLVPPPTVQQGFLRDSPPPPPQTADEPQTSILCPSMPIFKVD